MRAATGTDTGGSIRQPAALCGISGIKPTYGLVSRYGMIAFASSLDQGGPMAKSAEDLALLLNVMTGFDARDSTSLQREAEDYARDLQKPLAGLRIGLPKEYFAAGMSKDVASAIEKALDEYRKLGAQTVEISLPNAPLAIPVYYVLAPAEASSNLSRFDGVRYGHRAESYSDLADMYRKSRAQGFGPEVKRRILIGTYVLSHGYYDAYYIKAQKLRRLIAQDFAEAYQTMRHYHGAHNADRRIQSGRKKRRSDPDVFIGYLHQRGQSDRHAGHVDSGWFWRQKPSHRFAHHWQLLQGSANAECCAPIPIGYGLAFNQSPV
jgi:aspartyl-tRNA(Asn)/glutamyl-tRNA(Gln) amidotransferase subunit A